jgi:hypothetical protein
MKAPEQLANVLARLAWENVQKAQQVSDDLTARLKQAGSARSAADRKAQAATKRSLAAADRALRASLISGRQSVKEATALLEKLLTVHPTMERENIYGSSYKRLALIEAVAGQTARERTAIKEMTQHYQRAATIARETESPELFYPGLNYLAAELVSNLGRRRWKGLDAPLVKATRGSLENKNLADPDFWSVVAQTELQLYQALALGKVSTMRKDLEKGYRDLYGRVPASWMWSSVYDTTRFVVAKCRPRLSGKDRDAAKKLLACLASFVQPK